MKSLRGTRLGVFAPLFLFCACGDETSAPPSFSEVEERVFAKSCVFAACHSGGSPAGGLSLAKAPYANLVDAPSHDAPGKVRVIAGNPSASYLMEKLTLDPPTEGERMPPGTPLDEERLELVRAWIEAGAKPD